MIYCYQKHIDAVRTVEAVFPADDNHQRVGTELATIAGTTYFSLPDGTELPDQPTEITIIPIELTDALRDAIKAASPHVRLIDQRIREKIREKYDSEDEMYLTRISVSKLMGIYEYQAGEQQAVHDYGVFVESVRAWGKTERTKLGL